MTSASATFPLPEYAAPPAEAPGLTYQPDHAGEAERRLLSQFDSAARLHALVRALVQPLQDLEQAAFDVMGAFDVDTASGAQLDAVGALVGEARLGRSDVAYRAYVKARILANRANGQPKILYAIARALLGSVPSLRLTTVSPAHYDFDVAATTLQLPWDAGATMAPEAVAKALADALLLATSGGVSLTLFYQFTDDAGTFLFASGDAEEDDVNRGLADDEESDPGGALIGAEERF